MPSSSPAPPRILIVDDEQPNVLLLQRLLARAGYADVHATTDPRQAVPLFEAVRPDLVMLDLHMPRLDGFSVLDEIMGRVPPQAYLPVLVLTADSTRETRERALAAGARDFVTKPYDGVEVVQRARNLLQTRQLHLALETERASLTRRVQERTATLDAALREARAAGRARAQFLAKVSHELRTPLTALRGAVGLLGRAAGELPPAAERLLSIAGTNTERLLRLVEDMLLLQALESGEIRPRVEAVDLVALGRAGAERFAARAQARGLHLVFDGPGHPVGVMTDPALLGDVISRLVDNALRYTERGEVRVAVRGGEGTPASVHVHDTGSGVPAARLAAIFEAFEQVDNSDTRAYGGLGLGLAICRAAASVLGWGIRVNTEEGVGSEFVLRPGVGADGAVADG